MKPTTCHRNVLSYVHLSLPAKSTPYLLFTDPCAGSNAMLVAHLPLLQVRPSYAETSLRQVPFGASGRDHLLKAYRNSLMSVLLNQFDRSKRFQDGMQASSSRVGICTGICSISSYRLSRLVTA